MIKNYFLRFIRKISFFHYYKLVAKSQNKNREAIELFKISKTTNINKTFIEIGFHPNELNTNIFLRNNFRGLFIDGNEKICENMNWIIDKLKVDSKAINHFLSLKNMQPIFKFLDSLKEDLGVLSLDIDGNDYWILKKIITFHQPQLICVEYNASFGVRNISTPYEENFNRHEKHNSGLYHGASITAFHALLKDNYDLIMNIEGLNLLFLRKDKNSKMNSLDPVEAYKESTLRNFWSKTNADEQWGVIKNLKYEILK